MVFAPSLHLYTKQSKMRPSLAWHLGVSQVSQLAGTNVQQDVRGMACMLGVEQQAGHSSHSGPAGAVCSVCSSQTI